MDLFEKLRILTDAAKFDVACTSSGVEKTAAPGGIGSAASCGICHTFAADGRCVSLLKVLLTNSCVYDCKYCVNRRSNDTPRAVFTPRELAELTIQFYRRNYIEGLFLSSGAEIVREGVAACAELILADSALVTATKTESPQKIKKETNIKQRKRLVFISFPPCSFICILFH